MDLIYKIAEEEEERFKRFYKRYVNCPYARKANIGLPVKDNIMWDYNRDIQRIRDSVGQYASEASIRFVLNLELKSLREYGLITEKNRRKYSKMIRVGSEMRGLAIVIIDNFRSKRVKKYGYANFKL